jgi:hypothetical protein
MTFKRMDQSTSSARRDRYWPTIPSVDLHSTPLLTTRCLGALQDPERLLLASKYSQPNPAVVTTQSVALSPKQVRMYATYWVSFILVLIVDRLVTSSYIRLRFTTISETPIYTNVVCDNCIRQRSDGILRFQQNLSCVTCGAWGCRRAPFLLWPTS